MAKLNKLAQSLNQPAQATPLHDKLSALLHDYESATEAFQNAPVKDLTKEANQARILR